MRLSVVIGSPIGQSLSPRMHNAAYKACGLERDYSFWAVDVKPEGLEDFLKNIRYVPLAGVSVTLPHKVAVLPFLDHLSGDAQSLKAVNTITLKNGELSGHNTDWLGIVRPLEKRTTIKGAAIAVLGAGGAARAALYGLQKAGGSCTVFNRTLDHAQIVAAEFNCQAAQLSENIDLSGFSIVINTTSMGMYPAIHTMPVSASSLHPSLIVFDAVYNPRDTALLQAAEKIGAQVIPGLEMFVEQGAEQFQLYTGQPAPLEAMKKAVTQALQEIQ